MTAGATRRRSRTTATLTWTVALASATLAAVIATAGVTGEAQPQGALVYGERLTYRIAWHGIHAGIGVMSIAPPSQLNERDVFHVITQARSNDFVSLFYPVDDRVETFIDVRGLYPHRTIVHQREGKTRRDREVAFDHARNRATQFFEGREETFETPGDVQDSLSALYYLRTVDPLVVGQTVTIKIHDNGKNWVLDIKVLGKERVRTFIGTFDTIKVGAYLKFDGLWLDKGNVYVWFTDDARKVPVLVRGDIKIGAVTATLAAIEHGAGAP